MSKLVKYSIVLTLCKVWDLYTTWLRTPDLSRELNPLVKYLGFGWTGMIVFQVLAVIITILIVRRSLNSDSTLFPNLHGFSLLQFTPYLYFGKERSVWHLLYSTSTSFDRFLYFYGGILYFAEPLVHLIAGANNLLLVLNPAYAIWLNTNLTLNLTIGVLIVLSLSFYNFLSREYKAYKLKVS